MPLIAEDLLLLLLDDETGSAGSNGSYLKPALGGAVLIELALMGAAVIEDPPGFWKGKRVEVVPAAVASPPQDPVLADAVSAIRAKPRSPADLVSRLGKDLPRTLADRLERRGILQRKQDKVLGLFPRTRWPAVDSRHEEQVRERIRAVLVQGVTPDDRTGALIALLSAVGCPHKVIDRGDLSSREIKKRAKLIAEGAWAATAVRDAIQAAQTAVLAAATAGGAVTAASS